jgi:hypothetical protein
MLHLVDAGTRISTGSSAVEMLRSSVLRMFSAGVQRHGLARAGGAGDQDHAVGLGHGVEVQLLLVLLVAQLVDAQLGGAAVEDTQHDLLAEQGRAGADAEVHRLVLDRLSLMRPSCGTRRSAMSSRT